MASSLSPPMAKALGSSSPPLRRPRRRFFSVSADIKESSPASVSVSVANKEAGATEPVLSPPPGFKPPEPKPFTVGEGQILDIITASLALPLRFGSGTFVLGYSSSIVSPDEIGPDEYALDVQDHAYQVREMVSILDLDVLFYPCPRNGPNFRPKVLQMGGKQQFPYMVDPNTGVAMYESDNIIKYLADKYGDGTVPLMLSLGFLTTLTAGLAMLPRMGRGSSYLPAKLPPQPLVYWAYEGSPFCRLVREVLVELELPHLLRTVARGSPKRQELYKQASHFQAPYLEDPNTGVKMFESAAIVDYLKATYAQ